MHFLVYLIFVLLSAKTFVIQSSQKGWNAFICRNVIQIRHVSQDFVGKPALPLFQTATACFKQLLLVSPVTLINTKFPVVLKCPKISVNGENNYSMSGSLLNRWSPGKLLLPTGKSEEKLKRVLSVLMTSSSGYWQSLFLEFRLNSWGSEGFKDEGIHLLFNVTWVKSLCSLYTWLCLTLVLLSLSMN